MKLFSETFGKSSANEIVIQKFPENLGTYHKLITKPFDSNRSGEIAENYI